MRVGHHARKVTDLQTIEQIFLTNGGEQYLELLSVTVTSSSGNGAILKTYGDEVGKL